MVRQGEYSSKVTTAGWKENVPASTCCVVLPTHDVFGQPMMQRIFRQEDERLIDDVLANCEAWFVAQLVTD